MPKELKKIIKEIFINQKINKLQETEKDIKVLLGKGFLKKHIKNIFKQCFSFSDFLDFFLPTGRKISKEYELLEKNSYAREVYHILKYYFT